MDYEIGNPQMVWLLLLAPAALILMIYTAWRNRNALAQFGTKPTANRSIRGFASMLSLTVGIALLALACMDIRWGKTTREVPQKGLEVVFALDVSRSMLAEDARPNRLARAKQQITDMIGEMAGDRIGLVVFAGEAKQAIPLTNHYNDFRQKLESVGPHTVSKGGSQLGDAIAAAADAFLSKTNDYKTIILFTDGEDQESKPVELARSLHAENGMRIFTVGLGDMNKGARIPQDRRASGQFVEHQGQQVWSKLNGSILQQIATETQAAYIPAGTKRVNMADVYHSYVAQVEKSEFETAKVNAFIPRYQWFAFPAFACLFVHGWLTTVRNKTKPERTAKPASRTQSPAVSASTASPNPKPKVAANVAVALLVLLPSIANAQSNQSLTKSTIAQQINAANDLVRQGSHSEAIDALNAIETTSQNERDSRNYNLAIAHYENSDVDAAIALFTESAKSENDRIAADSRHNLGNCHFAKSLTLAKQPAAAIQELELAVVQYRSALRLDRQHAWARENLERAVRLIEQLKNEQEKNEEQADQQQDSPKENQQDQDQTKSSQQQDQANPNQDSRQSDDDQAKSKNESSNQTDDSKDTDSQDGSSNESDQTSSQPKQPEPKQPEPKQPESKQSDSQSDSGEEANPNQQSSKQPPDSSTSLQNDTQQQPTDGERQQQNTDQASGSQQQDAAESEPAEKNGQAPPQGEVTAANAPESRPDKSSAPPLMNQNPQNEGDEGAAMSRQEALKLLQSVRDRDMLRRLRQQQLQRSRRVRVEKDW